MRHWKLLTMAAALAAQAPAWAANLQATIYRNPNCGCCNVYAQYLRANGFDVKLVDTLDLAATQQKYGVPERLEGCHTALIGGYVFEGLVPAEDIKQVIADHRPIKGLSVPGMPFGAPGMPGPKAAPINVYYLDASSPPRIFATY